MNLYEFKIQLNTTDRQTAAKAKTAIKKIMDMVSVEELAEFNNLLEKNPNLIQNIINNPLLKKICK